MHCRVQTCFVRVGVSNSLDGMSSVKAQRAFRQAYAHLRENQLKSDDYSRNMLILRMLKKK